MNGERRSAALGLALCCSLFVVPFYSSAQNLVPNPSFELIDACPVPPDVLGYEPDQRPENWNTYSDTPDYFNACEPAGAAGDVPLNVFTFQVAYNGAAYSGMFSHLVDDHREMIGVELFEPLVIGQSYYGSFRANAAYGGPQQTGSACNNIGMLLTMDPHPWSGGWPEFPLRNYAQVYSEEVVSDTLGWTLVSGSFVADSAYRYLVIGNQFNNANTSVQVIGAGNPNKAYVLVDAVCLSMHPDGCPLATFIAETTYTGLSIWPNPANAQLRISWGQMAAHRIIITDALGRIVADVWVVGSAEVVIDVQGWANGVYQVLLDGDGKKHMKKFVVVR